MMMTRAYIIINKSDMEILCFNILIRLYFKSKSGTIGSHETSSDTVALHINLGLSQKL